MEGFEALKAENQNVARSPTANYLQKITKPQEKDRARPARPPSHNVHAVLMQLFPSFPGIQKRFPTEYAMEGVRIKWNDILDAEFAESWPVNVIHEPMGLVKYMAPKPSEEAESSIDQLREKRLAKAEVSGLFSRSVGSVGR